MGWLAQLKHNTRYPLNTETVIGRGPSADIRLQERFVSSLHAALTWAAGGWGVKDLGSHNGTAINGTAIPPGMRCKVEAGDEVSFGQPAATWTLVDDSPPQPYATDTVTGEFTSGRDGLLVLPGHDNPKAAVFAGAVDTWRLEVGDTAEDIADRQTVAVDDRSWVVRLPESLGSTRTSHGSRIQLYLSEAQLTIDVDDDGRGGSISVDAEAGSFSFPLGTTMMVLEQLARARTPGSAGWLEREELLDRLSMTGNGLNVSVFRLRRKFAEAGFADAAQIVERGQRRIRLGTARVTLR
ncbi:MAG: FHA domain-containing protein [Nannocystales bacterium]